MEGDEAESGRRKKGECRGCGEGDVVDVSEGKMRNESRICKCVERAGSDTTHASYVTPIARSPSSIIIPDNCDLTFNNNKKGAA